MKNSLLLLLMLFIATQSAFCQRKGKTRVSGPVETRDIQIDDFHSIGMSVGAKVYLSQGPQKVSVKAQSDLIDLLEREVEKGAWKIEFTKRVTNYDGKMEIYITMPDVKSIAIAGSGDIIGKTPFDNLDKVSFSISGSGDIAFSGSANSVKISIAGSGDVSVEDLRTQSCSVSIAGSGDANVHATKELKVSIAGSGDVNYKGKPRVKSSIAGSGNLNSM